MPFYNCITQRDLLSKNEKEQVALEITDLHCQLTGAPRQFVHVVFSYFDRGDAFSAAAPSRFSFIRAGIRAGRASEVKLQMLNGLAEIWNRVVKNSEPENLLITFSETGPGNVMESGLLLPDPKDDAQWKKEHAFE